MMAGVVNLCARKKTIHLQRAWVSTFRLMNEGFCTAYKQREQIKHLFRVGKGGTNKWLQR